MNKNNQTTAAPAAMQEQQQKPNDQTETHATKTENPTEVAPQTGGVSSPVPCSAGSSASDQQVPISISLSQLEEAESNVFHPQCQNPSLGTGVLLSEILGKTPSKLQLLSFGIRALYQRLRYQFWLRLTSFCTRIRMNKRFGKSYRYEWDVVGGLPRIINKK